MLLHRFTYIQVLRFKFYAKYAQNTHYEHVGISTLFNVSMRRRLLSSLRTHLSSCICSFYATYDPWAVDAKQSVEWELFHLKHILKASTAFLIQERVWIFFFQFVCFLSFTLFLAKHKLLSFFYNFSRHWRWVGVTRLWHISVLENFESSTLVWTSRLVYAMRCQVQYFYMK